MQQTPYATPLLSAHFCFSVKDGKAAAGDKCAQEGSSSWMCRSPQAGSKAPAQHQIFSRARGWRSSLPSQPTSLCRAAIVHPEHTLLRSLSASSFLLQPGHGLISNTNNFLKKEMPPIWTKSPLASPSAVALLLSAISPFSSLSFTATVF